MPYSVIFQEGLSKYCFNESWLQLGLKRVESIFPMSITTPSPFYFFPCTSGSLCSVELFFKYFICSISPLRKLWKKLKISCQTHEICRKLPIVKKVTTSSSRRTFKIFVAVKYDKIGGKYHSALNRDVSTFAMNFYKIILTW